MAERLAKIPGVAFELHSTHGDAPDETISGIKADVAVKIFGDDPDVLTQLADKALRIVNTIPGAADTQAEVVTGVAELHVQVDRAALARYGLNVTTFAQLLDSSTGGLPVSEMIEGQRRFPIAVRLPEKYRSDLQALGQLNLQSSGGRSSALEPGRADHQSAARRWFPAKTDSAASSCRRTCAGATWAASLRKRSVRCSASICRPDTW